jgi:hypothetical protein
MKSNLHHIDSCKQIAVAQCAITDCHSLLRHGQTYYKFSCHLVSYPKCHKLFDCTVDELTLCCWVDQGVGFTVELLQYTSRTVLKWKELRLTDFVECWEELANRSTKLNEWDFGCTRKITLVVANFESKVKSVDGDVQQTTPLLLAYYQKQSQCLQNEVTKLQAQVQSRDNSAITYSDDFPQLLKSEIQHPTLAWFCQEMDGFYLFQLKEHYNGFHYLNSPLVSVDYRLIINAKIRLYFPGHYAVFSLLALSEYRHKPCFIIQVTGEKSN